MAALFPLTEVKELVTGVVAVPRIPPFELDRPVPLLVSLDISEELLLLLAEAEAEVIVVAIDAPSVTWNDEAVADVDCAHVSRANKSKRGVSIRSRMVTLWF